MYINYYFIRYYFFLQIMLALSSLYSIVNFIELCD